MNLRHPAFSHIMYRNLHRDPTWITQVKPIF